MKFLFFCLLFLKSTHFFAQSKAQVDSFHLNSKLSLKDQKVFINRVFEQFYSICNSDTIRTISDTINISAHAYIPSWQSYYDEIYYPVLEKFPNYYQTTKDTFTLCKLFNAIECSSVDGEFGQTLSNTYFKCFLVNKKLFLRQVRASKYCFQTIWMLKDGIKAVYLYNDSDKGMSKFKGECRFIDSYLKIISKL